MTSHIAIPFAQVSPTGSSVAFTYASTGNINAPKKAIQSFVGAMFNGEYKFKGDYKIPSKPPLYPTGYIGHELIYNGKIDELLRYLRGDLSDITIDPKILKTPIKKLYKLSGNATLRSLYNFEPNIGRIYRYNPNHTASFGDVYDYNPVLGRITRAIGTGVVEFQANYDYGVTVNKTVSLRGEGRIEYDNYYEVLITNLQSIRGEGRIEYDHSYLAMYTALQHYASDVGYLYINDQIAYSPVIAPTTFLTGDGGVVSEYSYSNVFDPVSRYFSTSVVDITLPYSYSPQTTTVSFIDTVATAEIAIPYDYSQVIDLAIHASSGIEKGYISDLDLDFSPIVSGSLRYMKGQGKINLSTQYAFSPPLGNTEHLIGDGQIQLTSTLSYTTEFGNKVRFITSPSAVDLSNDLDYRPVPLSPINYALATESPADFPLLAFINSDPFVIFQLSKSIDSYTETYTEVVPFVRSIQSTFKKEHYAVSTITNTVAMDFLSKGLEVYALEHYASNGTTNIPTVSFGTQPTVQNANAVIYAVEHYASTGTQPIPPTVDFGSNPHVQNVGAKTYALEQYTLDGFVDTKTESVPMLTVADNTIYALEQYVVEGDVYQIQNGTQIPPLVTYPDPHDIYDLEQYTVQGDETRYVETPWINDFAFEIFPLEHYVSDGTETTIERTSGTSVVSLNPITSEIFSKELYVTEGSGLVEMPTTNFVKLPENYELFSAELYVSSGVRTRSVITGLAHFTGNTIYYPERYALEGVGTTDLPTMIRITGNTIYPDSISIESTSYNRMVIPPRVSLPPTVFSKEGYVSTAVASADMGSVLNVSSNIVLTKEGYIPQATGIVSMPVVSVVNNNTVFNKELYVLNGDESSLVVANNFINSTNIAILLA